jgi:hypothetical protein
MRIFLSPVICALPLAVCVTACGHPRAASSASASSPIPNQTEPQSAPSKTETSNPHGLSRETAPLVMVEMLQKPKTKPGAKRMLDRGFFSLKEERYQDAAAAFRAVLATDYLTDRGRMNLYWMTAQSHKELNDRRGEWDALEGFVLAGQAISPDLAGKQRLIWARARLAAMRVQDDTDFGRTPEKAIFVEDINEPAQIMAAMECEGGKAQFRALAIRSVNAGMEQLVYRRVACQQEELDLWFNITYAQPFESAHQMTD